ncbi:DMT family transporter [Thioclava atlantica]|uniref:DMT family transporter n=1 Tax=Thioclava atlantica TaxID=1317124 RepID=UPI0012E05D56|nr:DMT family transporter [Thioclava atlantica]
MTETGSGSGAVAGLLTGIQVGAALFASQLIVSDVGVGLLGLLRYGIALLLLFPLLLLRPSAPIARADWLPIILLGLGQIGMMIALLNTAVAYTSAARVALIFATLPAVSMFIDLALGRPFGGRRIGLGVALSIGGVAVLVGADAMTGGVRTNDVIGMGAAAGATLCVAVCSSLYAPFVRRYGPVKISSVAFTVSLIPLGLIAVILPSAQTPNEWTSAIWWLILAIGLSSGIGYLMWFHAIEKLPATLVTGFLALSPITAAVLSLVSLATDMTPSLLIAVAIVCGGILCFARFKERPIDRKEKHL